MEESRASAQFLLMCGGVAALLPLIGPRPAKLIRDNENKLGKRGGARRRIGDGRIEVRV